MKSYNGFSPSQREKASRIQRQAIKDGVMPNPNELKCVLCGQDRGIRHYHNEDYSDEHIIDNARCLCWRCHMMIHGRFAHPKSFAKYMIDVTVYKKRFPPVFRGNDWDALEVHMID